MPIQHSLFGRVLPRLTPRRLTLFLAIMSLLALFLIASETNTFSDDNTITVYDHKISVPKIGDSFKKIGFNPSRQPAHAPPRQKDDESNGSAWWADWKWLSTPFSNSVTRDDDRALLPYLTKRQPIYCYYDATEKKAKEEKEAESERLLIWRRAWWARGFRPMILSASEAMNSPLYQELQHTKNIDRDLQNELMRWLAWDSMEGGLLSQSLLIPVGVEYHVLPYLRRGQFTNLTRWENLADGLFAGSRENVQAAIRMVLASDKRSKTSSILDILSPKTLAVDKAASALAYYSGKVVEKKYSKLYGETNTAVDRQNRLNQLITAHLHTSWQNSFPDGIEVIKPFPQHTTAMVANSVTLAKSLASCPTSPLPASCPPNLPNCRTCSALKPVKLSMPEQFHNTTEMFSIGTVPHPWTLTVLNYLRDDFNVSWVREEVNRDPWILKVAERFVKTGKSNGQQVLQFKKAVAEETSSFHSLWVSAERPFPTDLDFYFGFALPNNVTESKSKSHFDQVDGHAASEEEVEIERKWLEKAKKQIALPRSTAETKLRGTLELWSMADTEAWKFIRALQARRQLERQRWEAEEAKYSKGSGSEMGRTSWNRWSDGR